MRHRHQIATRAGGKLNVNYSRIVIYSYYESHDDWEQVLVYIVERQNAIVKYK